MPLVLPLIGAGIGALASSLAGWGAFQWLSCPEAVADPAQFRWLQSVFLEETEEQEREEMAADLAAAVNQDLAVGHALALEEYRQAGGLGEPPQPPGEYTIRQATSDAGPDTWSHLLETEFPGLRPAGDKAHQEAAADLCYKRVGERRKRPRARTRAFLRYWMARVKLQFPMRSDRPSDRAAMTKWLEGEMRPKGIRHTHMAHAIPMVIRLSLVPDLADSYAQVAADVVASRTRWGRACYNFRLWLTRSSFQSVGSAHALDY